MKQIFMLTPFPKMVEAVISESILGRSEKNNQVKFHIKNLFDFADSPHQRIDDYPFGGGSGMILKPEPIFRAYDKILTELSDDTNLRIVFPTPDGKMLNHAEAFNLSQCENLVFICGHYKGIDQRIRDEYVSDEISIGDFVLTGGELPSMIIIDSIVRLKYGVLNNYNSAKKDSFYNLLLDGPHYTRPRKYKNLEVPKILLSGNHKEIERWFLNKREEKTKQRRTDLWKEYRSMNKDGVNNG